MPNIWRILFSRSEGVSRLIKSVTSGVGLKQVMVVRSDLNMGKGKIAAQCSHPSVKAVLDLQRSKSGNEILQSWLAAGSKKVVTKSSGAEDELENLVKVARTRGLYATCIRDAGLTQIAAGSMTVCVVGPGPEPEVDAVTGHFKLL